MALTPAAVFAYADADGEHSGLPVCGLRNVFAAACSPPLMESRTGSGLLMGRSPWSVPKTTSADVASRSASHSIDAGSVRVVPSVVYVPRTDAGMPGIVSVGLERGSSTDPLRVRGELGWSGRAGGSFEVEYRAPERNATFKAEERPFGTIDPSNRRAPGQTWDAVWTERLAASTTGSIAMSSDSLDLPDLAPEATAGRVDLQHRAGSALDLFVSLASSSYADASRAALKRGVVSVGTDFKPGVLSLSATYRSESSSMSPAPGRGGRLALRSSVGNWKAGLYADVQQHAATLEIEGAVRPDLPQPLVDMGLAGAIPENALRLLRDSAPLLAQHRVEFGALRVDPWRYQGGVDIRWRDSGQQRTEVAVLLAMDDLEGSDASRRALLGQVRMSWRLFRETDLTASYANWSLHSASSQDEGRSQFSVLLRSRL